MKISATVVTESPESVLSQTKKVTGQAPAPTPTLVGALLFVVPRGATEPVNTASTEGAPEKLPKTGTTLPLIGLLGMLSLAASLGMRFLHQ